MSVVKWWKSSIFLGFLEREELTSVQVTKCLYWHKLWKPQPGILETPALIPQWREMSYYRERYFWFIKT